MISTCAVRFAGSVRGVLAVLVFSSSYVMSQPAPRPERPVLTGALGERFLVSNLKRKREQ